MLSLAMSVRPSVRRLWNYLWNAVLTNLMSWVILKSAYIWKIRCFMSEWSDFSKFELQVANLCNLGLFENKFVCTVLTDLLTRFFWKLSYVYVIRWWMSEIINFFKITTGSCKFMQLAFFCKYICVHGFDWSTNSISLKKILCQFGWNFTHSSVYY